MNIKRLVISAGLFFSLLLIFQDFSLAQFCSGRVVCPVQVTFESGGDSRPSTRGPEIVYQAKGGNIVSNIRGVIAQGREPDINANGEVVYVREVVGSDGRNRPQIFSTGRTPEQLTNIEDANNKGAYSPSINSHGEIVYIAATPQGYDQLFSTVRGQLTSTIDPEIGGSRPEQPEIDDTGRVVFAANSSTGTSNIWELDVRGNLKQLTFFQPPKEAVQPTLAAETEELVYVVYDKQTHTLFLISERDGELYKAPPDPGANFGVFPDLSPQGVLVFQGVKDTEWYAWLGIRASDGQGNICSIGEFICSSPATTVLSQEGDQQTPQEPVIESPGLLVKRFSVSWKAVAVIGVLIISLLGFTLWKRKRWSAPKEIQQGAIFIGHGRSEVWKELKDFIQDRLGLSWEEFNRESTAGVTTVKRLEEMLNRASFAFLVMTAEDEHSDNMFHARENVVHEAGLFQGRLGFERAIILLEDGCSRFSNIDGLTHIPFPKGNIQGKFEEIRRVLEREGLL